MASLLHALGNIPPSTASLAATTLAASYPFITNLGDYQRGMVAILNGRLGQTYMSPQAKVRTFAGFFRSAAPWIVGSTTVSAALAVTTGFLHPSPLISQLLFTSGVLSALQVPATILLGIPKAFGPLLAMDREDKMRNVPQGSPEAQQVDRLIQTWEQKHLLRFAITGPAFALAFLGLILDGHL